MSANTRVTDRLVAAYADDLARIVPLLGVEDTEHVWNALKKGWSVEEFRGAIDQYRLDGSVTEFQLLVEVTTLKQREKSYWKSKQNVLRELRGVIDRLGRWPSGQDLRRENLTSLSFAMWKYYGGVRALREELGFEPEDVPPGYWDDVKNVVSQLEKWVETHGSFPTHTELSAAGQSSLASAIVRHGGFQTFRERLGQQGGRFVPGHWDDAEMRDAALRKVVVENNGIFPSAGDLRKLGHLHLLSAVCRHGGLNKARERLGYERVAVPTKHPNGYWHNFEHVRAVISEVGDEIHRFPTPAELRKRGHHGVVCAIYEVHGGMGEVRSRMGVPPEPTSTASRCRSGKSTRAKPGQWRNWENVEVVLRPLVDKLGRMPTQRELQAAGLSGLVGAITKHFGGMRVVARRMGLEPGRVEDGLWKEWDRLKPELEHIARRFGGIPSHAVLVQNDLSWISPWIVYHGGFDQVRHRLGYALLTDEHIAAHADVLAVVIPHFRDPAPLWVAMKRQWLERDLDAAVAEFTASGSLVRFEALMNG